MDEDQQDFSPSFCGLASLSPGGLDAASGLVRVVFIHSFIRSFIRSFVRSFVRSCVSVIHATLVDSVCRRDGNLSEPGRLSDHPPVGIVLDARIKAVCSPGDVRQPNRIRLNAHLIRIDG